MSGKLSTYFRLPNYRDSHKYRYHPYPRVSKAGSGMVSTPSTYVWARRGLTASSWPRTQLDPSWSSTQRTPAVTWWRYVACGNGCVLRARVDRLSPPFILW